jgi:hypothetical protein
MGSSVARRSARSDATERFTARMRAEVVFLRRGAAGSAMDSIIGLGTSVAALGVSSALG